MPRTLMSFRKRDGGLGRGELQKRQPPAAISLTSCVHVCGFMATIRSQPPRRPMWPASETRTSYQVGRPWMLDGKMLRVATGTPMRRVERANGGLGDAAPEPLTLANLTTKSLTRVLLSLCGCIAGGRGAFISVGSADAGCVRHVEQELLHVPRPGRAALGAEAAVEAEVLVLGHDPLVRERHGYIEVLRHVASRRREVHAQPLFRQIVGE